MTEAETPALDCRHLILTTQEVPWPRLGPHHTIVLKLAPSSLSNRYLSLSIGDLIDILCRAGILQELESINCLASQSER